MSQACPHSLLICSLQDLPGDVLPKKNPVFLRIHNLLLLRFRMVTKSTLLAPFTTHVTLRAREPLLSLEPKWHRWYAVWVIRAPGGTLLYSLHDVFSALFSAYMYDVCMLPLDTCVYSLRWDNANTCSFYRQFLTPHSSARVLQNGETLSVSSI